MSLKRTLVAGIGNIFLGDDAFGVEVAQRLMRRPLPAGVDVVDFGIRGIDLVYALQDGYERVILVDAIRREGPPGTLHVIEPEIGNIDGGALQTHEMTPMRVLSSAKSMGVSLGHVLVVGCEPESLGADDDPQAGLSAPVEAAVDRAVALIESIVAGKAEAAHA